MTREGTTLRGSTVGALLTEPVRVVADSSATAKAFALMFAAGGWIINDLFAVAFVFAFVASTMDYLIGHRLAEQRGMADAAIAANGLLVKLAALALLLFVYGMDSWFFTKLGIEQGIGMVSAGCCAVWIHNELKSIDRLTKGRILFIRPFLVVLDAIIGRLLPEPEEARDDAEPGVAEFIRRRQDEARLGHEPPQDRDYDAAAIAMEEELETPDGTPFRDAVRDAGRDP